MKSSNPFNRNNLNQLPIGKTICHKGIIYKKLSDGDGRWTINSMVDGQRIHRVIGKDSNGTTLTTVKIALEQFKTDARHDRLNLPKARKNHLRVSEAVKRYFVQSEEEGGKDLFRKEQRFRLHLVPYFGNQVLTAIKTTDVEKYKKQRLDSGAKPATINRELAAFSHLANKAVEWEWIPYKPFKVKLLPENNSRQIYLTKEECQKLLQAAKQDNNPQIYLFILIGLQTGMRRSEILTMQIENIHPEQNLIYIPKAKAGARQQPMHMDLASVLKAHLLTLPKNQVWLFPSIGNMPSKTGYTTSMEEPFRRVVQAAGLDPKKVTIHTLRHTATSHLVQAGVDIPTVQAITGHKTPSMVYRYAHQNGNHVKNALEKLQSAYAFSGQSEDITQKEITHRLHTTQKPTKTVKAKSIASVELELSNKWYPQGNSNPCRLREREVS